VIGCAATIRLRWPKFSNAIVATVGRLNAGSPAAMFIERERIAALPVAGQTQEALAAFSAWFRASIELGVVPPIGADIAAAFHGGPASADFSRILREGVESLIQRRRLVSAMMLCQQVREPGDAAVSDEFMTQVLEELNPQQSPLEALFAVGQLQQRDDRRAADLLDQLLEQLLITQVPQVWLLAARIADAAGRKLSAIDRLETAVRLDDVLRPDVVNSETGRANYRDVLGRDEQRISAAELFENAPLADLPARIVTAADQWRSLDDEDGEACRLAANLLTRLGASELAWNYLVTPLAENSGESGPWMELARAAVANQSEGSCGTLPGRLESADKARTAAFRCEAINPEILLEHARLMKSHGRSSAARRLLEQVTGGSWQPQFAATIEQAKLELAGLWHRSEDAGFPDPERGLLRQRATLSCPA
jgi:tetratricopeptide (TPR) repeat protein